MPDHTRTQVGWLAPCDMMRSIFNPGRAKISLNASSPALADETSVNRLPARIVIDLSRLFARTIASKIVSNNCKHQPSN
jgi:hypothetical protein